MDRSVSAIVCRAVLVAAVVMSTGAVAGTATATASPGPTVAWEVVELGFGGEGAFSTAVAINDRGVVVGFSHTPEDAPVIYVRQRGRAVEIGRGEPSDINDGGVVAGTTERDGTVRAAIWRNGREQVLTGIPGDFHRAQALNDRGQVVGYHPDTSGYLRGFLWHRGQARDLPPVEPTDVQTVPTDIDEDGTVVGYSCGDGRGRPAERDADYLLRTCVERYNSVC